jgi:Cu(I)-responsive transcriptional regulator
MDNGLYNIGTAAKASGLTAKMIRRYEEEGLLPKASRTSSGYRSYNERDIHMLRFIRHARNLGFPIKQVEELLDLWRDQNRTSSKVKMLAQTHIRTLEMKIEELTLMKIELERLAESCRGDHRPECPILDTLAQK